MWCGNLFPHFIPALRHTFCTLFGHFGPICACALSPNGLSFWRSSFAMWTMVDEHALGDLLPDPVSVRFWNERKAMKERAGEGPNENTRRWRRPRGAGSGTRGWWQRMGWNRVDYAGECSLEWAKMYKMWIEWKAERRMGLGFKQSQNRVW